jgi:hypothetical protein
MKALIEESFMGGQEFDSLEFEVRRFGGKKSLARGNALLETRK